MKRSFRACLPVLSKRHYFVYFLLMLGTLVMILSMLASSCVRLSDSMMERDPDTGMLEHAAPRTLGPVDAETAILLVHGFLGTPHHFDMLPEFLADAGYNVHVMLLPGHGTTPLNLEKTTREQLLYAVEENIRTLNNQHQHVIVLGHSMGGALSVLAAKSVQIDGLILAAPLFEVRHRWYYGLHPERWAEIAPPIVRWVYKRPGSRPVLRREVRKEIETYVWVPTSAAYIAVSLGQEARTKEALSRLNMPVCVIHGIKDSITSPEASKVAFDAMPSRQKSYILLENSEHLIFWDYEREYVQDTILEFIKSLSF